MRIPVTGRNSDMRFMDTKGEFFCERCNNMLQFNAAGEAQQRGWAWDSEHVICPACRVAELEAIVSELQEWTKGHIEFHFGRRSRG